MVGEEVCGEKKDGRRVVGRRTMVGGLLGVVDPVVYMTRRRLPFALRINSVLCMVQRYEG